MSGSRRPVVSLTTFAPAASACRATSGRKVSAEMMTSDAARTAAMTGTMRSASSDTGIGSPGEKGAPPMSTQSAPSSTALRAASTAACRAKVAPPS